MHAGNQHTCVLYMTSHIIKCRNYKSRLLLYILYTTREVICRHAVAKVRLLFESGFYSRMAFIQDFTVLSLHSN